MMTACAGLSALVLTAPGLAAGWSLAMVSGVNYDSRQSCVAAGNASLDEYQRRFQPIDDRSSSSSSVFAYEIGGRNGLDAVLFCISRPRGGYEMTIAVHAGTGREDETAPVMNRLREILQR